MAKKEDQGVKPEKIGFWEKRRWQHIYAQGDNGWRELCQPAIECDRSGGVMAIMSHRQKCVKKQEPEGNAGKFGLHKIMSEDKNLHVF